MPAQHRPRQRSFRSRSPRRPHGRAPAARGIATLEFAVAFPLAVLVVLSLVQVGLLGMGKLMLNHITFMAARQGAVQNADEALIRAAVIRGLAPFYQDSTEPDALTRLRSAQALAAQEAPAFLSVERLSPGPGAFDDFGLPGPGGRRRIPNDNLRWRHDGVRAHSGVNIQDANLLKIKVRYGQALKVPLMGPLVHAVMCGGHAGAVPAWQARSTSPLPGTADDCTRYYAFGRVPVESFAVVQMHSAAEGP